MAKRKNRQHKKTALEHNCKCPHCGRKIRGIIPLPAGNLIEHWWSRVICNEIEYPQQLEKLAIAKLKKYQYVVKDVVNESA